MCIARLVLQHWYGNFKEILDKSEIGLYFRGLYVDDGRKLLDTLPLGNRIEAEEKKERDDKNGQSDDEEDKK